VSRDPKPTICIRSHLTASTNTQTNEKTPQADDAVNASAATSEQPHNADQTVEERSKAGNDQDEPTPQPQDATEATEPLPSHANGEAASTGSTAENTEESAITTQDDQEDHVDVVEGEEDTVIY
jgi:hypothetical protein